MSGLFSLPAFASQGVVMVSLHCCHPDAGGKCVFPGRINDRLQAFERIHGIVVVVAV